MKVAIIGSRSITDFPIGDILPAETTEIISGGAKGVDLLARRYAEAHGIPCTELLPDYEHYGRAAPLRRNDEIIARADLVLAVWDGKSRGTAYTISQCRKLGRPVRILSSKSGEPPKESAAMKPSI